MLAAKKRTIMNNRPHITNMRELEAELHRLQKELVETESSLGAQWDRGKRNFLRLCLNSLKCRKRECAETGPLFSGSGFIKEAARPLWKSFLRWASQKRKD